MTSPSKLAIFWSRYAVEVYTDGRQPTGKDMEFLGSLTLHNLSQGAESVAKALADIFKNAGIEVKVHEC